MEELKTLPSVGEETVKNIVFRVLHANITAENLATIKFVNESKELLELMDFEPNSDLIIRMKMMLNMNQHQLIKTRTNKTTYW